ncbi:tyrosyl-tRNA deacylase [Agrobacterium tumefaciens]|uniref:tyrosyl-tRNA deacylase n=1 Tax=Agrobacterium tumefaciens TaxID=358 RepID=UPI0015721582|nr:tyrosyl-tRNA deacylase [Agrobacterium tumefaciens]NSX86943.1 tyrosyl-tRNA deacylase [Agrobacterium tumefaciens]
MNNVVNFESRAAQINSAIDADVDAIVSQPSFNLPKSNTALVRSYVDKIQGTYDVERAKRDTDNAIDLLYIAYNTTPQEEDKIRNRITAIMNGLIASQQKSEIVMRRAIDTASRIGESIAFLFPDWLDVKEGNDQAEVKAFVSNKLIKLAEGIRDKALKVRDDLVSLAKTYDAIIDDITQATSMSETALSRRLEDKAVMEREIREADARREQLETLVKELTAEVAEFEKKASEYEKRANTAEDRAFIMSIVRVGAQMISGVVPAIAMVAGGPASMLASSVGGALSGQSKDGQGADGRGQGGGSRTPTGGDKADAAATQSKLSEQKAELRKSEEERDTLKTDIKVLQDNRSALAKDAEGADPKSSKAVELAELDRRLTARAAELKAQEEKIAGQQTLISSLQASLDALDKGLGKLTDEQQQQAASLREIQMQMIDKAEAYQKERRTQTAELIKINALLKGKQAEDDKIKLAVQSLNVSITALKRMKEIIQEVAFFFKSFADFMQAVADDAEHQIKAIDNVAELEVIRKNRFAQLVRSVDEFFVRQSAQWHAVVIVSDLFNRSFADGWSTLNKLQGTYIPSGALPGYLAGVAEKLSAIVAEREAAADAKIASLQAYRQDLSKTA